MISRRKRDHLRLVLEQDVTHRDPTFLDDIHLLHRALPELDLSEVSTSTEFFDKRLHAPLMIASMTGGAETAGRMNRDLAVVAQRCGIALAVGSQRVLLRHPEKLEDFAVRKHMPLGVLLGNIGAVQLPQIPVSTVVDLVDRIEADGICVHLNVAQEICQPEGDRRFRGLLDGIAELVDRLDGRVLVKETGAGLSPETIRQLNRIGVKYIDVAGRGGTSWTKVEMHRAADGPVRQIGETFSNWGVPTAYSIIAARTLCDETTCIVAGGGIRDGLDCARAIAAGAHMVSLARHVLLAYAGSGVEGAVAFIERLVLELRAGMLLTSSADVAALRHAERIYTGELRQWLQGSDWAVDTLP